MVVTEVASVVGCKLKKEQQKSILELVSGKDVFVCLPTGYGKSLCCHMFWTGFVLYNIHQFVLVVSPLVALMKDQVTSLSKIATYVTDNYRGSREVKKREK